MNELKCEYCNKLFTRKSNLKYHLDENVCKKEKGDYTCMHCGKQFTRKNSMHRHIKHYCKLYPNDKELGEQIRKLYEP